MQEFILSHFCRVLYHHKFFDNFLSGGSTDASNLVNGKLQHKWAWPASYNSGEFSERRYKVKKMFGILCGSYGPKMLLH